MTKEELRYKIIAAAKLADPGINEETVDFLDEDGMKKLERLYAIAFEAGRVAEREECEKLATINRADLTAEAIRARGDTK